MSATAVTIRLDHEIDIIALGARSGLLWAGRAEALAGVGRSVEIDAGCAELAAAQVELASIATDTEVDVPGSGPVAFAALPFDRRAAGRLIVPEIVVGRSVDGRRWLTTIDVSAEDALGRIEDVLAEEVGADPSEVVLRSVQPPREWAAAVERARHRIRTGELDKVVLAREIEVVADRPFDPAEVLLRMAAAYPGANLFRVDGFVGATPELLVSRHGDVVRALPLAGTAPRSSDPAEDARLAAGLFASAKNRSEHQITIDTLIDGLLPACSYVDAEPEPHVMTLANVQHLSTMVEGRLSSPPASVLELVAALHPTPAVGGRPTAVALDVMSELEVSPRGSYAGPVGWVDGRGNGAFGVALRCGQIDERRASVFAGVGIVAGSEPMDELEETRAKLLAFLGALVRP